MVVGEGGEGEKEKGVGGRGNADSRVVHKGHSEAVMTLKSCPELAAPPLKEGWTPTQERVLPRHGSLFSRCNRAGPEGNLWPHSQSLRE